MHGLIKSILSAKTKKKHEKLSSLLCYIFVKVCKIDQRKYYILGSYALRKNRNINDLDINLDADEFMKLEEATKKGWGRIEFYNGQIRWFFDLTKQYNKLNSSRESDFSIEAFMKDPAIGFPTNDFSLVKLTNAGGLEKDEKGHQFLGLQVLLKWKKAMKREKDKSDIELISSLL